MIANVTSLNGVGFPEPAPLVQSGRLPPPWPAMPDTRWASLRGLGQAIGWDTVARSIVGEGKLNEFMASFRKEQDATISVIQAIDRLRKTREAIRQAQSKIKDSTSPAAHRIYAMNALLTADEKNVGRALSVLNQHRNAFLSLSNEFEKADLGPETSMIRQWSTMVISTIETAKRYDSGGSGMVMNGYAEWFKHFDDELRKRGVTWNDSTDALWWDAMNVATKPYPEDLRGLGMHPVAIVAIVACIAAAVVVIALVVRDTIIRHDEANLLLKNADVQANPNLTPEQKATIQKSILDQIKKTANLAIPGIDLPSFPKIPSWLWWVGGGVLALVIFPPLIGAVAGLKRSAREIAS